MQKYRNAMGKADSLLARTSPGQGATQVDDGLPGKIHLKGVPNLSTGRLTRAVEFYHGSIHTPEGLQQFDQPRQTLVDTGMKLRATTHELTMRGVSPTNTCKHCWKPA